ncbi:RNA polymerase sporulation sigma factor SigH [soil metagenome]
MRRVAGPALGALAALEPAARSDEQLLEGCWAGDDDALGALLQRYRPVVRAKARSYFVAGADREDVVQEGMIGLCKAIRDFDVTQRTSFRGFAELCITRQIITAVKSATRHKHTPLNLSVSLHTPVLGDDGDHDLIDQLVADATDPADEVVSSAELAQLEQHCAEVLSALETEVLQRYVEGQSYAEIAVALERHVKSIDNALQRIKRKLDPYLVGLEEAV